MLMLDEQEGHGELSLVFTVSLFDTWHYTCL